jgi:hypothetical protein
MLDGFSAEAKESVPRILRFLRQRSPSSTRAPIRERSAMGPEVKSREKLLKEPCIEPMQAAGELIHIEHIG